MKLAWLIQISKNEEKNEKKKEDRKNKQVPELDRFLNIKQSYINRNKMNFE